MIYYMGKQQRMTTPLEPIGLHP
jgi:hypothetical protein